MHPYTQNEDGVLRPERPGGVQVPRIDCGNEGARYFICRRCPHPGACCDGLPRREEPVAALAHGPTTSVFTSKNRLCLICSVFRGPVKKIP